ncbi:MAG: 5-methylcytosine-specific restriction endonuclease system specificity protein McrC [Erysipelotrichaceae bacterium]
MIKDKSIQINNIFHMLTYAFQVLKQTQYDEVESEKFDNIQNLFAAILARGVSQQLKHGLYREYINHHESLTLMRGKLDINETIRSMAENKQVLACDFDELSENCLFNQIIKSTCFLLIKDKSVERKQKESLKRVMMFFGNVDMMDPKDVQWSRLRFQQNNKNYQLLLNICYFVLDGLLQTTENGKYKMTTFSDEHMEKLYEKFVLEYYRYHHQYLNEASASRVNWQVDDEVDIAMIKFLPIMQTDITLRLKEKILIIDTKYYANTMQVNYEKHTLHSNNLYQIYTYVKNRDFKQTGNVSGMVLYAKTDEAITPDCEFHMSGNRISVKTLDLGTDFRQIARQLDEIAFSHFGINKLSNPVP